RWSALWDLFDGDAERLNLAHECVDRWGGQGTALRLKCADGRTEAWSFQDLAAWSSRFANLLETESIAKGDRVAVMLDPSLAFYGAIFGAVKRGAVAVPLFTLLGPDGVRLRVDDCQPRLLLVTRDAERWQEIFPRVRVLAVDDRLQRRLAAESPRYAPATRADDLAILQYTSGTTRGLPEGVRLGVEKLSFTGEPMDSRTREWVEKTFGVTPCSMYGSTEVGVIIVNYPGFTGYVVKPGALGRSAPGWEVAVVDARGEPLPS